MIETDCNARQATGQIKWFDPTKGFGFILDDAGGPDILLHANVLRNFGQNSVSEGVRVQVMVVQTGRGLQAVQVMSIEAQDATLAPPVADLVEGDLARLRDLPFVPARVKWFDKAKGFGFANVFGEAGDVFLHVEVLRHGGFADLVMGEAVALKVVDGRRGRMAAQIGTWDRPLAPRPEEEAPHAATDGGEAAGSSWGTSAAEEEECAPQVTPPAPCLSPVGAEALAQPPRLAAKPPE